MCTLSLSPLSSPEGFVMTSNRDEAPGRANLPPEIYTEAGFEMLYPKDLQAGGTWIGVGENRRVVSLLNGGSEPHRRNPPYRLSRGVVVKDFLKAADLDQALAGYELQGVEPFTMIIAQWETGLRGTELIWDGNRKHIRMLPGRPLLWSSSPLYAAEIKKQRQTWFSDFIASGAATPRELLDFHQSAGKGDLVNGVIMDRGYVKTRSISQIVVEPEQISFFYRDLESGEEVFRKYDP